MSARMTLDDLAKKYNNFSDHSVVVVVDEEDMSTKSLIFQNVKVTLTSGFEASYCSFSVLAATSVYDKDELKVSNEMSKFSLGKKIHIYVTYGDKENKFEIFTGYITSQNFEYSGRDVNYEIEAMDLKSLMMNNLKSEQKKDVKRYSEAITNLLDRDYTSLYDSLEIDQTDEIGVPIEQYNQSDYNFVVSIAKKLNYLFYIINGTVYFKDYNSISESILTIYPCDYLMNFKREISLSSQIKKVTVRSNDELNPSQPIEGSATTFDTIGKGEKSARDITILIDESMHRVIIDNSVKSVAEAESRAKAELTKASLKFAFGEFETFGIPELVPGKYVTVEKINDDINNDYFIKEVTHIIDVDSYKTICKYEVNKI